MMRLAILTIASAAPLFAAPAQDLKKILSESGVQGGVVVHLGCGDGTGTAELRANEHFLVHGLDTDPKNVEKARERIRSLGLYGPVSVDLFDGARLPYADNLVNLIVAEGAVRVPPEEILRALAPRGVAVIGGKKTVKPWPGEIDEWTHFLHGPDNNAVGRDRVADLPRSIQWVSEPRWGRSHEEMASMSAAVTAKGRIFYIVDEAPLATIRFLGRWALVARDAFNGTLLWKKEIPRWSDHLRHFRAGPVHLPRRLVAAGDEVYVTLGLDAPVTALDAATGKVLRTYAGTERTEEILEADGTLYVATGTSEVNRKGGGLFERGEPEPMPTRHLMALHAGTGRPLWKITFPGEESLLPLTLTVTGPNVFCQSTTGLMRLDARSGKEIWKTGRQTVARRMSFSAPTVVAAGEVLLCADRTPAGKEAPSTGKIEWGVHGWNEPDFARKTKCTLQAYAVETGKELWSADCSEGYNSPVDVFVVGDTVWVGSDFKGYDLKTGKQKESLQWKGDRVGMAHHRCYRNKATENYILTGRSGIELVSLEKGWVGNNSWIRGTCQYGIIPANGLLYAPPNACACFLRVKVEGFFAAAPQRGKDASLPFSGEDPLDKGPLYGKAAPAGAPGPDDWPMYRRDAARSGSSPTAVPPSPAKKWSASIGGRLTQPVVAGGRAYIASIDTHTLHALDAASGKILWSHTAGGRIDSAPTLHQGMVLFGSADGRVTCLEAGSGGLVWRFRAAPQDQRIGAFGQLESVWPVHASVLAQNDTVYAVAGRSTYLDGGMVLYRLDPLTGKEISRTGLSHLDPRTGKQTGAEPSGPFDMEGSTSDILSGDGNTVYLKHLRFDASGKPMKETEPHLFSITGFLGEEWFVRTYWLIGTDSGAGWGGWANAAKNAPSGRILCFDKDYVYGYGRKTVSSGPTGHRADAYHLFARDKVLAPTGPVPKGAKKRGGDKDAGAAFGQRRKTLLNSISAVAGGRLGAQRALAAAGIDSRRRGETLSLEDFMRLAGKVGGS